MRFEEWGVGHRNIPGTKNSRNKDYETHRFVHLNKGANVIFYGG